VGIFKILAIIIKLYLFLSFYFSFQSCYSPSDSTISSGSNTREATFEEVNVPNQPGPVNPSPPKPSPRGIPVPVSSSSVSPNVRSDRSSRHSDSPSSQGDGSIPPGASGLPPVNLNFYSHRMSRSGSTRSVLSPKSNSSSSGTRSASGSVLSVAYGPDSSSIGAQNFKVSHFI